MNTLETIQKIKQILVTRLLVGKAEEEIGDSEHLFEGGLELDSSSAIEFVLAVEEEFGLVFEEDDMRIENFANPRALAEFMARNKEGDG